jgi:hypothetical protein
MQEMARILVEKAAIALEIDDTNIFVGYVHADSWIFIQTDEERTFLQAYSFDGEDINRILCDEKETENVYTEYLSGNCLVPENLSHFQNWKRLPIFAIGMVFMNHINDVYKD